MSDESRFKVRSLLQKWRAGDINEIEAHERAEELNSQYAQSDKTDDKVCYEMLAQLEILNHQLVVVDDIPFMLELLNTPVNREQESLSRWQSYWDGIDYALRRRELRSNPYYIT